MANKAQERKDMAEFHDRSKPSKPPKSPKPKPENTPLFPVKDNR